MNVPSGCSWSIGPEHVREVAALRTLTKKQPEPTGADWARIRHLERENREPRQANVLSALQMLRLAAGVRTSRTACDIPHPARLLTGALIGFLSGATGAGGGVFLAPVIPAMNRIELLRTATGAPSPTR